MSKQTKTIEVDICDFCSTGEGAFFKCLGCNKDVGYECRKIAGVEYSHAIYFSGTGDGFYCHTCRERLAKVGDPLLCAYQRIESLKNEIEGFNISIKRRAEEAEATLKRLRQ